MYVFCFRLINNWTNLITTFHSQLIALFYFLAAKRKLVFVGKKGYDIFGRNKLFVPRLKWDALKDHAEKIKEAAKTVEKAYNDVKSTVEKNENFAEV